ncbi:MAG: hypothetical protein H7177_15075 [Rhizobacter sp.]|nr:hypothetical protein [Bacteriovorax sp.]
MKIIFTLLLFLSFNVYANNCSDLNKCIEQVSKLTTKKYIYDPKEIKGGVKDTSNNQLNAENADTLFTYILSLNGYARVPTAEKDTFLIISARDIRYHMFPTLNVDSETPPSIIPNYDYYMMSFKFKHFNNGQLREAANSLRPFMSRYARVIELKGAGSITIQENAANLVRAYGLIKSFDRELSKEEIEAAKVREVEFREDKKSECKENGRKKEAQKDDEKKK